MVKIGRSADPEQRRKAVANETGTEVTLEYIVEGEHLEKHAHEVLKSKRIGGEWFSCSVEEAIEVLDVLSKTVKVNQLAYTKEQLDVLHRERLEELLVKAHSPSFLARMLGCPVTTVQGWIARGRISKVGAILVEENKALGEHFKANYLRPDLS